MVECAGHKRPYRSSEADALALTDFTFGLDIVLFVIPLIYATRSQHHVLARASYREGLRLRQEMHQVEQRLGIVKGLAGLTSHFSQRDSSLRILWDASGSPYMGLEVAQRIDA